MKKNRLVSIMMILVSWVTFAQIGIGTTSPDASSALEINSVEKGFLMPRMTTAERIAIVNPALGLLVYDTDTKLIWSYDGAVWVKNSGAGKFVDGGAPDIAYYEGRVGIGLSNFSTAHKLFVDGVKSTDGTNTAARINATYTGSGTSVSTYGLANIASNNGTGTIYWAMGTRSTIDNVAGGDITYGDATRSEVNNSGNMTFMAGSTVQMSNSGNIVEAAGDNIGITNTAGNQIGYAYTSYLHVLNEGTMTDVYGQLIDYGDGGTGTVANSYGLVITGNFNKGTVRNFAIHSASNADSYLEGNLGIGLETPQQKIHISGAMRLEPQATAPTGGGLGDLYAGTDGNLYFHDGVSWKQVSLVP